MRGCRWWGAVVFLDENDGVLRGLSSGEEVFVTCVVPKGLGVDGDSLSNGERGKGGLSMNASGVSISISCREVVVASALALTLTFTFAVAFTFTLSFPYALT